MFIPAAFDIRNSRLRLIKSVVDIKNKVMCSFIQQVSTDYSQGVRHHGGGAVKGIKGMKSLL